MAVLSDDHCAEAGAAALRGIVAGVLQTCGAEGVVDLAIELASKLGELVEQIAQEQSLPAVDVLDILFID